jgi:hypothetical protein
VSEHIEAMMRKCLASFVTNPPDTDFQKGYVAGMLVFANEVLGIPRNDPTWADADALLDGHDCQISKVLPVLTVIDGGKP